MALINKKGYFFSLTVLLILVLVYVYFSSHRDSGFSRQSLVVEQRLQEINRVVNLVEKDAETGLRIALFRTILDLDSYVGDYGAIDPSTFPDIVKELLLNGSIDESSMTFSDNNSLSDWEGSIVSLFGSMGLSASFSGSTASLSQNSHWDIVAHYGSNLFVNDPFSKSNWSKNIDVRASLPITRFYDPLFSIHATAKRNITKFPYDSEDISNLNIIIDRGFYVESNLSPSFLQRFQNLDNFEQGEFIGVGIESLIDLSAGYISPSQRPIIDWLFFTDKGSPCQSGDHILAVNFNNTYDVPCTVIEAP